MADLYSPRQTTAITSRSKVYDGGLGVGARFELRHANLMAYVTSRSFGAPRTARGDLHDFLFALKYEPRKFLIPERGFEPWPEYVSEIAGDALSKLENTNKVERNEIVSGGAVERLLEELRIELSDYSIFALAVGESGELRHVAERLAQEPLYGELLVLIPEFSEGSRNFEVLDPIPAFSVALHSAAEWPGMVFWTPNGTSAFVTLDKLEGIGPELKGAVEGRHFRDERRWRRRHRFGFGEGPRMFDALIRSWSDRSGSKNRRLLHLSDLHFGTKHATENQPLLDAELREVVKSVDRVVITGDLIDSPNEDYFNRFAAFRNNISHLSNGVEPLSITGNHDQRMKGIFGKSYEQVANLKSTGVEIDDNAEMSFILLNSSVEGAVARGAVTVNQLKRVGAEYRTLTAARPEIKDYLPVVLVHHHPFSFDLPPETFVQRALKAVGLKEETMLELSDADDLHRWCLDWGFSTILHGHKHKARYVAKLIENAGRRMALTSIGCGSSLGAEGSPVSYNLMEWNPERQRWIASFFESVNGGAFKETATSVSPLNSIQKATAGGL